MELTAIASNKWKTPYINMICETFSTISLRGKNIRKMSTNGNMVQSSKRTTSGNLSSYIFLNISCGNPDM